MNRQSLVEQIRQKKSYLCIGLDTDIKKIPIHLLNEPDPVFSFNKAIIDATSDLCVSYKINTAFYESMGVKGWETLEKTVQYIPDELFTIADAKRGDIGNTAAQYAKTFFEVYGFDAITVNPYMGEDSVRPFLEYDDKWTIVLGLTSNPGAADFELLKLDHHYLYERVIQTSMKWGSPENLMYVIGATQSHLFSDIRKFCADHFFLVPGVGTQGGDLQQISAHALNKDIGVFVNVSRAVIYASDKENYAREGRSIACQLQQNMLTYF